MYKVYSDKNDEGFFFIVNPENPFEVFYNSEEEPKISLLVDWEYDKDKSRVYNEEDRLDVIIHKDPELEEHYSKEIQLFMAKIKSINNIIDNL